MAQKDASSLRGNCWSSILALIKYCVNILQIVK